MENIKEEFIKKIEATNTEEDIDWNEFVENLPDCYAKGWLSVKLNHLLESVSDNDWIKEDILEWCTYKIWK